MGNKTTRPFVAGELEKRGTRPYGDEPRTHAPSTAPANIAASNRTSWKSYEVLRLPDESENTFHLRITPLGEAADEPALGLPLADEVFDIVGEFLAELLRGERDGRTSELVG